MTKILIQGVTGIGTQERIKSKDRKPDKFYYGIRHEDENIGMPATIEDWVYVNHYADLEMDKELDMIKWAFYKSVGDEKTRFYRELTGGEQMMLMEL